MKFTLDFEFGELSNGKVMTVEIGQNDHWQPISRDKNNRATVSVDVDLPSKVSLRFLGKNMNTDTKVDENNNIVEDLYVRINRVSVDGFDMDRAFMHQQIKLVREDGSIVPTCYVGFNGCIDFNFEHDTVFKQVMGMRRGR